MFTLTSNRLPWIIYVGLNIYFWYSYCSHILIFLAFVINYYMSYLYSPPLKTPATIAFSEICQNTSGISIYFRGHVEANCVGLVLRWRFWKSIFLSPILFSSKDYLKSNKFHVKKQKIIYWNYKMYIRTRTYIINCLNTFLNTQSIKLGNIEFVNMISQWEK